MSVHMINGVKYLLPEHLSVFQLDMYVHLIEWKWRHITRAPGHYKYGKAVIPYDAILPGSYKQQGLLPHIYGPAQPLLAAHRVGNPFRIHKHFYHMASSQAANINLFLPILHSPLADAILGQLKPDFKTLATDQLDQGYCIEYWGGNYLGASAGKGLLADKAPQSGTDSDLAIAYRNHSGELCLWLIEHKLTEAEFTTCGGFKSNGRQKCHDCTKSFAAILAHKSSCYYHDVRKFKYWDITDQHQAFFANHGQYGHCPFQCGMNQLWRNQLLALAVERAPTYPFKHAYFSVVRHPRNTALDTTLNAYQALIGGNPKFFAFTSADVLAAAGAHADPALKAWIDWYKDLYLV